MANIVTGNWRCKRPPRMRKRVAIERATIVTAQKDRRWAWMAAKVSEVHSSHGWLPSLVLWPAVRLAEQGDYRPKQQDRADHHHGA